MFELWGASLISACAVVAGYGLDSCLTEIFFNFTLRFDQGRLDNDMRFRIAVLLRKSIEA